LRVFKLKRADLYSSRCQWPNVVYMIFDTYFVGNLFASA